MCGAALEVIVNFSGKIVWAVDPNEPDLELKPPACVETLKNVRVVCSADVMHSCGYVCQDGVLVESAKKR